MIQVKGPVGDWWLEVESREQAGLDSAMLLSHTQSLWFMSTPFLGIRFDYKSPLSVTTEGFHLFHSQLGYGAVCHQYL